LRQPVADFVPDSEAADPVAQDLFHEDAESRTQEDPTRPWLAPNNGNADARSGGDDDDDPDGPMENHLRRRHRRVARAKVKRDDPPSEPDERDLRPEIQRGSGKNHTLSAHWPAMTNPQLREFCDMFAVNGKRKGFTGDWEQDTGTV
jgi:hypothetical protein